MAEGGILEKFPDSWDPQYLWTVVVEYLLNDHPIDILIKRLVFYYYICYFNILIWDESSCNRCNKMVYIVNLRYFHY